MIYINILIMGGTVFLGRHLGEIARERGHSVTLFNRGNHPDIAPDIEQLHGDRDGDLKVVQNRVWDAVIDTSGYVPRIVRKSAKLFAQSTDHYTFISSISVYKDFSKSGLDETTGVGKLGDESIEEVTGDTYGPLKALCESAVKEELPGRSLIVRPGLIVGPYDSTDRFTYWPWRVMKGGKILVPGDLEALIQWIDARDLALWILEMTERKQTGTYHATGPAEPLTLRTFLKSCAATLNPKVQFQWAKEDFLLDQGVDYWTEMPLWIPRKVNMRGFLSVDNSKAIQAGLSFRPVQETIRDTAEWVRSRPSNADWKAGMSAERERELLEKIGEK